MTRRNPKQSAFFNRRTFSTLIFLFFAIGAISRILKPYWQDAQPENKNTAAIEEKTHDPPPIATVVRIIDGDTIKVRHRGRLESIRLLYIDTPETNQPGFEEAKDALQSIVGKEVRLKFEDPNQPTRDKYNRLLAYVISGGINTSIEMVNLGWSKFYTKFGKGRLANQFEQAQRQAHREGRGLWGFEPTKSSVK
jgi:micrococcal nuclease